MLKAEAGLIENVGGITTRPKVVAGDEDGSTKLAGTVQGEVARQAPRQRIEFGVGVWDGIETSRGRSRQAGRAAGR